MSKDHFRLTRLEALRGYQLRLTYADGQTFDFDLQAWIKSTKALRALKDSSLFAKAKLGTHVRSVDWIRDELDLGATTCVTSPLSRPVVSAMSAFGTGSTTPG